MIVVADNLHILNPAVAQAVENLDADPIRELVRYCEQAGAQAIDINPGPLVREPQKRFAFLVETVREVTNLPLVLDTGNAGALEAGLAACGGKALINGFSLEPAKLERILPLAQRYDADIIGYLLNAHSQVPIDAAEMMAVAVDLFQTYVERGLAAERLIIDPVIAPLSWHDGLPHNQAVLEVLRNLEDLLGAPVRTMAGLSNLASGPAAAHRKVALEMAYLPMLAAAGLDMVLLNVRHTSTVRLAQVCDALLGDKIFAWTQLDGVAEAVDPST